MEIVETWKTIPKQPATLIRRKACLVHIYPTGPGMGSLYSLGDAPQIIGRGEDCDLRLEDQSVSRNHVRIQPGGDGHYAIDLNSTNGTFVNDQSVSMHKLRDGDFLRIGNRIFRYLSGESIEAHYHEEIYRLTIIDALTGVHNKRYLLEFLERELARAARYQRPLGLIMFDLDRFKSINDRLGHLGGDYALRELVRLMRDSVRKEELLARYGGEEFGVVLPETTQREALQLADRLRQLVEQHTFQFGDEAFQVTISLGVITTPGTEAVSPEALIRQADEKLFQAKNAGRNCVVG
jgi:diguanylate cyclase (GGDEF)-like protein